MKFKLICVIFLSVSLGACVTFTSPIDPLAQVSTERAYLFGVLSMDDETQGVGHLRMGLVAENVKTKKSYKIQFNHKQGDFPAVVSVEPGEYKLTKIIFASWNYEPEGEKAVKNSFSSKPFKVESGKAYYIGNISAASKASAFGITVRHEWDVKAWANSFESDSKMLLNSYPSMINLKLVNMIEGN